jgi:DNA recombination protein RmuC
MLDLLPFLTFLVGLGLGGVASLWIGRSRQASETQLADTFKALAADTLNANSAAFLQLAESKLHQTQAAADRTLAEKSTAIATMVEPVKATLAKMDAQIQALEVKREGAYRELAEMVAASRQTQQQLRAETGQLLQALRAPTTRGAWGEIQLQRLLEMTGMSEHAQDFTTQTTFTDDDGKIRPDVIVALPGERAIIIDSKVPLAAYLDSVQSANDATRQGALKAHAKAVKDHIKRLGAKSYWTKVENAPDFVVLFLPGEHFLAAALDADSDLLEYSVAQHVVLATPMTLIALLRTIAQSWRQEAVQENARAIGEMGRKLYAALAGFTKHMDTLGARLSNAVESFNKASHALDTTVLAKARKFDAFGAAEPNLTLVAPTPIDRRPLTNDEATDDETDATPKAS